MRKAFEHLPAAGPWAFGFRPSEFFRVCLLSLLLAFSAPGGAADSSQPAPEPPAPSTPREFFNAGTQKLQQKKFKEAEAFLESALAGQDERLQPPALYNLGHVRFSQGAEELKKGPAARPTAAQGHAAAQKADDALRAADEALAANDLRKMVDSYMQGRGARKEVKAATKAVQRALETYGAALHKWERSAGDFKSATELKSADADARKNAELVERSIAKLVDSLHELQQAANAMGDKQQQLGEKLKQLKGRIPAEDMPPGAAGDDEEDEEAPNGPKPGQQEGPTKDGQEKEVPLSPEQAGWLLEGLKLDSDRRLPMTEGQTGQPTRPNRRTW